MLSIGTLQIPSACILAPLAGVSDLPFRLINREFGCAFAFTEMVSARALTYDNKNTLHKMLATEPADRPLGIQLLGNDPEVLRAALVKIGDYDFGVIDFNAACPVTKVTVKGEGASLLKDPVKLRELLRVVVNNAAVPVTVKIRAGWDSASVNARDVALHAQDAGIHGLCVHGRTREQGYQGRVDYRVIYEVKKALTIPVLASGDALSPQLIKKLFDETGCDGVAIARGALGNPWIFRDTLQFLQTGSIPQRPDMQEIADTMIAHLKRCVAFHGEGTGTPIFRKFFNWYTRGLHEIRELRCKAYQAGTEQEMIAVINNVRLTYWDPGLAHSSESELRNSAQVRF
jgi:tRNA-dihydrouridine synthase B